jgi:hypothetical protein
MEITMTEQSDTPVLPEGEIRLADGRRLKPEGRPPNMLVGVVAGSWKCSDGLAIIVSISVTAEGPLMHVSMVYPRRPPSWHDVRAVRDRLFPRHAYVVVEVADQRDTHIPHCIHLQQLPRAWHARLERPPAVPTTSA